MYARPKITNRELISFVLSLNLPVCRYIKNLHTYLLSFMKRTLPLVDVDTLMADATSEFETQWEDGKVAGWVDATVAKPAANGHGAAAGIWCASCKFQP